MEDARDEFPALQIEEINVAVHPEVAVKYGVMSAPAIAINGRLEFVGVPREEALLGRLRAAAGR
jgi:hypothetical protein